MHTYVVRIYRRDANDLENLIGIVEEVETEKKLEFRNLQSLIAFLSGGGGGAEPRCINARPKPTVPDYLSSLPGVETKIRKPKREVSKIEKSEKGKD